MLRVCLYNIREAIRQALLSSLEEHAGQLGVLYQVTDSSIKACLEDVDGSAALFLIGVDKLQPQGDLTALKVGRHIIKTNRSHYVVLVLESSEDLEDVLSVSTRLAGVLCLPLVRKRARNVFNMLLRDYLAQRQDENTQEDARVIELKTGSSVYRVPVRQVVYAQAVDKKIEIVLATQTLQLYANMEEIMQLLGDGFLRCHRSYIVNKANIKQIDWPNNLITLTDTSTIPISRGYRAALKEEFS
ncbi:MAG: LytR/AlgR family response regulator transcription factor [Christensenellales bacterium]|jgi:DNA-binding LytR/AlgR family response regulator